LAVKFRKDKLLMIGFNKPRVEDGGGAFTLGRDLTVRMVKDVKGI
jgi:hypothetical protein